MDPVIQEGEGFFDPGWVLGREVVAVDLEEAHPNDDLTYSPEYQQLTREQVERMLEHIQIPDVEGERYDPWLKVLMGVHHWSGGSDEGLQLANGWSSTQTNYAGEDDVRRHWDSCGRREGYTIGTVVQMALEGGFTFEINEHLPDYVPGIPDELADLFDIDSNAQSLKDRINANVAGKKPGQRAAEAVKVLEELFIYVADQEAYFSSDLRLVEGKDAIRQRFRASMPTDAKGQLLDPCKLLEHSLSKRKVASMGYHPGESLIFMDNGRRLVNRHVPYNIEPLKPTKHEKGLFMELIQHVFPFKKDSLFRNYILQFLAYAVQNPGEKISSAPLLWSEETGTGKTTLLFELPKRLFGEANCNEVIEAELGSSFTDYLSNSHLIYFDEIFMGGMKNASAAANRLKPIITNATMRVYPKGEKGYSVTNRIVVTACSNWSNAVYLTEHDRRWGVHEVLAGKMDKAFAEELYAFMDSVRGRGVLKYIFQNIPTVNFKPYADAPMTWAKKKMVKTFLTREERAIREGMQDRAYPFDHEVFDYAAYSLWLSSLSGEKVSAREMQWLQSSGAAPIGRFDVDGKIQRLWAWTNAKAWNRAAPDDIAAEIKANRVEKLED